MNTLHIIAKTSGKLHAARSRFTISRQFFAFAVLTLAAVIGCICAAHVGGNFTAPAVFLLASSATVSAFTTLSAPTLGVHMELVSFAATAPAAGAAAAALSGDSLVVKNGANPRIVALWADFQSPGYVQLQFPTGHDTTRGLRLGVRASEVDPLLPEGVDVPLSPQENISAVMGGSATAGQRETASMIMLYDNLPGSNQRGISWGEFLKRKSKLTSVYLTLNGAAAGYTGSEAINADSDLLLANRDYAIVGGTISAESATIAIIGPDFSNVRIGFPANEAEPQESMNFFPRLARAFNLPLIPVFNSGNKANTLVSLVQDENNISPSVSLLLALLD
jgi:hypothetical protein